MKWNEISVGTKGIWADAVSDILMGYGAGGVEIVDNEQTRKDLIGCSSEDGFPDICFFDSSLAGITVRGYFPEGNYGCNDSFDAFTALIREKITASIGPIDFDLRTVDEADWANEWKRYYKPFHITDKVVIKPSWEAYSANVGEIPVEMDPGMAFGTGTHETTSMCAALIEKHLIPGMRFLDVGCGSGILSIIALLLGASRAVALDIDTTAVRSATENAARNDCSGRLIVYCKKLDDMSDPLFIPPDVEPSVPDFAGVSGNVSCERAAGKAGMAVANISADAINALITVIPRYVSGRGIYIVSGVIKDRKAEVLNNHISAGYEPIDDMGINEWVAMAFKCPGSM